MWTGRTILHRNELVAFIEQPPTTDQVDESKRGFTMCGLHFFYFPLQVITEMKCNSFNRT